MTIEINQQHDDRDYRTTWSIVKITELQDQRLKNTMIIDIKEQHDFRD